MIYNENCLDTLQRTDDDSIDLVVTSPPYDNLREYEGYSFDFDAIAPELVRVLKKGGVIVWVVGDGVKNGSESGSSFRQALAFKELGLKLYDTMIYQKLNYPPKTHRRYEQEFEYMFVLSKGKPKTFNPVKVPCKTAGNVVPVGRKGYGFKEGAFRRREEIITTAEEKIMGNIWSFGTGNSKVNHPAVMPYALAERHVLSWSDPGDLVYDPFCGSGTVPLACEKNGRRWLASEISSKYVDTAISRIYPDIADIL